VHQGDAQPNFKDSVMTTLPPSSHHMLRIDSSARLEGSHSRLLGDHFETAWLMRFPTARITRRDVALNGVSHISSKTITGMFSAPEQHTTETSASLLQSDSLIAEIMAADSLLLTVPMYNFGIPSSLKAWIDQITRIGHTFSFDGKNFAGLCQGRKAYIVIAYGASGYTKNGSFAAANFAEPYLKFLFTFLGFDDVVVFNFEATNSNPNGIADSREATMAQIQSTIAKVAA
jgi:FMN-dependent NADH-azoreductase